MLNPRGTSVDLAPPETLCWNSRHQGPVWSPNGSWIGHTIHYEGTGGSSTHDLAIVNPSTGEVHKYKSVVGREDHFTGWADNENFIEVGADSPSVAHVYLREAISGRVSRDFLVPEWRNPQQTQITPVPPSTGAAFVTYLNGADGLRIVLLRKNFTVQKTLFVDVLSPRIPDPAPRVDPFGEFVGWTRRRVSNGASSIAIKPLNTPSSQEPSYVGEQFDSATFCDWTEDGKILAAVSERIRGDHLVVLDRSSKVFADIPGSAASQGYRGTASWRKYMHN
jgi:hypothetical protein